MPLRGWGGCNNAGPVRPMATPSAFGSSLAREPCMDRIHVVGKSLRPQNSFPCLTILALRQKAPLWLRLRRRRAGSRRRRETEGVALGRSISPRCAPRNTKKYLLSKPPHSPTYSTREKKIANSQKTFQNPLTNGNDAGIINKLSREGRPRTGNE